MKKTAKKLIKIIFLAFALCAVAVIGSITAAAEMDDELIVTCDHEAQITGASLAIDEDISLNYYAKLCDCRRNGKIKMVFTYGSVRVVKGAYYDKESDEYVFNLGMIVPEMFGDPIKAELVVDGDKVVATKEGYSVADNCKNLLAKYPSDEKLTYLLKAILNYGAAAQNYREHNIDALINKGYEIDTVRPTPEENVKNIVNRDGAAKVEAANIQFEAVNKIYIKVNSEEKPTVTVNGKEAEGTYDNSSKRWIFYTENIKPDSYSETVVFTVTSNDPETVLTYSLSSYVYSAMTGSQATLRNLMLAIYTYGHAVVNYLAV